MDDYCKCRGPAARKLYTTKCAICGLEMDPPSKLKIGAEVGWVSAKPVGKSICVKQHYGKIVGLSTDGSKAEVKPNRGRAISVLTSRLELKGDGKGQLTKMIYKSGAR